MKLIDFYWDHPALAPYLRSFPPKSYLFRQGDPGLSMIIIVKGVVELRASTESGERSVAWIEAGQFLGENAILGSVTHKRVFSAYAKNELRIVELDKAAFDGLRKEAPELVLDILVGTFHVASDRLHRANDLVRILRSSNNGERLARLIVHLAKINGREGADGAEFLLKPDMVRYYLDLKEFELSSLIEDLVSQNLLKRVSDDVYALKDPNALLARIPQIADSMTTIPFI